MNWALGAATAALFSSLAAAADLPPRVVPGPQADGSVLLHNQWPIRPVGRQTPLGEFPVTIVVHPKGRYAAILHSGYGPHQIWVVDLTTSAVVGTTPVHETYGGLVFSPDGQTLYCSGSSDGVVHSFHFDAGHLQAAADYPVSVGVPHAVVAGVVATPDGRSLLASVLFASEVVRVPLTPGGPRWVTRLDPAAPEEIPEEKSEIADIAPNDNPLPSKLVDQSDPFGLAFDRRQRRVYAALWGRSDVAVLDAQSGKELARWKVGLHPNQLLLSGNGRHLFVSNGGRNSISVVDTRTGEVEETLCSAFSPTDPPGVTPDSLALSPDGRTLLAANGYANNVAVFDVSTPHKGSALGFIPTGWFPTAVELTPDGRQVLVASARGLEALPNVHAAADKPALAPPGRIIEVKPGTNIPNFKFPYIGTLYHGSLAQIDLPPAGEARDGALQQWTQIAERCRPAPAPAPAANNPVPAAAGGPTPIRYVIYIIKENRTYDEVFGDMKEGNGDPSLCLFPEQTTPNLHRLARQFVLLDNFYANAEISASGHEWSMGGYSSEFVERNWPLNYSRKKSNIPYPAEGGYLAAVPELGYIWDRAAQAGVSFRDFGEFVHGNATEQRPSIANLPVLEAHVDPYYRGWSLTYSDLLRADRYISELHRFEAAGEMPHFQIVRMPNDHTEAAKAKALTPRAMVAQNDEAVGRVIDALSHSPFWPQMAIFIVEDDAQNGPDHVDAHRTEALVVSPYTQRAAVDSSAYTTCSMLATMERILGLKPMSLFDASAAPMYASFSAQANVAPYSVVPPGVSLEERNPPHTRAAAASARFNFSHEDAIDDQAFNRVIWAAMRGDSAVMPAPVHAAYVRSIPQGDDDDDDD